MTAADVPHPPSSSPAVTDRQRARFTRDEIPRLAGLFGFVALLHLVGFGLFYFYNSQPRYHDLVDPRAAYAEGPQAIAS